MSVQAPARPRRIPWLALFGVCAAAAVAIPATQEAIRWQDPQELQRVLKAQKAEVEAYNPAADPPLGELAPHLSMLDTAGRRVEFPPRDARVPSAVVFIGDCTSCAEKSLAEWQQVRDKGYPVFVVTSSEQTAAERFVGESGLRLPMLLGRTQPRAAESYNAAFRPRAFVADAQGKLIYAQSERETGSNAIQKAAEVLRRAGRPSKKALAIAARRPGPPSRSRNILTERPRSERQGRVIRLAP